MSRNTLNDPDNNATVINLKPRRLAGCPFHIIWVFNASHLSSYPQHLVNSEANGSRSVVLAVFGC